MAQGPPRNVGVGVESSNEAFYLVATEKEGMLSLGFWCDLALESSQLLITGWWCRDTLRVQVGECYVDPRNGWQELTEAWCHVLLLTALAQCLRGLPPGPFFHLLVGSSLAS